MRLWLVLGLLGSAAAIGCSASVDVFSDGGGGADGSGASDPDDGPNPTTSNMTSSMGGTSNGGAPGTTVTSTTTSTTTSNMGGEGTGGQMMGCESGPNDDEDDDGWTANTGDCNDCDGMVSPGSIEIVGNLLDDDCDGSLDDVDLPCDGGIDLDEADPIVALRAMELCKLSNGPGDWGIASASWVMSDGAPPPVDVATLAQFHLGHGVLSGFGSNVGPRAGAQLLALSNGSARNPLDPDFIDPSGAGKGYGGTAPPGFPKESPSCPGNIAGAIQDPVAVQAVLRVPNNATGFAFANDFYSHDFPAFVCSTYDDAFLALLAPAPAGASDGNIAFYPSGDLVSVNGALFDVCGCAAPPCMAGGKTFACTQGVAALAGTGVEDHAATGWQLTQSPAEGGSEITLRLTIFDGSDGIIAATVLLDQFTWLTGPGVTVSTVADP